MQRYRTHGWDRITDDLGTSSYLRRRWGLLLERDDDELKPVGENCVRKNPHLRDRDDYFVGSNRNLRYQLWRKHLFTQKGVCRRCGFTTARREELKNESKDQGRPEERTLVLTPVDPRDLLKERFPQLEFRVKVQKGSMEPYQDFPPRLIEVFGIAPQGQREWLKSIRDMRPRINMILGGPTAYIFRSIQKPD
jgi:hypothetical protein